MKFPTGQYGRQKMEFFPAPTRAPIRAFAALVFPWDQDEIVLANICDRGWCIPSGRVEPGEDSQTAVCREAAEEAGITLKTIQYIGCYKITEKSEVRWADVYTADVESVQEISSQEESLGRMWAKFDQLPTLYHLWNPLTEAVFQHAYQIISRARLL